MDMKLHCMNPTVMAAHEDSSSFLGTIYNFPWSQVSLHIVENEGGSPTNLCQLVSKRNVW